MTAEPAVDIWPLRIEECECHTDGLAVFGEIDLNGHDEWEHALRLATGRTAEAHVHLAELRFIDVRGVTLLVNIADELSDGKRVVVHDAPPGLHRVMEVLWPDSGAAIEIEGEQR
ncbi:STAS domain-containing protein [Glycomyces terrestris]|uniref:STAS domain-containing protein n=1 Tax=Glycomyces terrestris TaxID=2493553 RepID=UPI0013150B61|nr:STAS domain-containing protein [Glycomyces terrestris]